MAATSVLTVPVPALAVTWDGSDDAFSDLKDLIGSIVVHSGPDVTFYDITLGYERSLPAGHIVVKQDDALGVYAPEEFAAKFTAA